MEVSFLIFGIGSNKGGKNMKAKINPEKLDNN